MGLEYAVKSDPGLVRENNEDSYLALPEVALFAVADGMGGHNAGEVASALAVEALGKQAERLPELMAKPPWWRRLFRRRPEFNPILFLQEVVTQANTAIFNAAKASTQNKGMGTTIAAALRSGDTLLTANVGDSRVYRLRKHEFSQLTQDHSLAAELVRQGVLTPEEALYSTPSNILTKALGVREEITGDIVYHSLEPDDLILIGSDGLTGMLEDDEIAEIITRKNSSLQKKVDDLVEAAKEAGGEDNITVALIKFF
jgi:serine/threonine protein phosphatase PrpC